jgi:restriction system protein
VDYDELSERLQSLRRIEQDGGAVAFERGLFPLLFGLLQLEGYKQTSLGPQGSTDLGIDARAIKRGGDGLAEELGVQIKYRRSGTVVSTGRLRSDIASTNAMNLDRLIVVSNVPFSDAARAEVAHEFPLSIELVDVDQLSAWVDRHSPMRVDIQQEVELILLETTQRFATLVARDSRALKHLEWRDLERIVASVFESLGFSVELTPSSKDGGRDVVLECRVEGRLARYLVEVKHWRAGNKVGGSAVRDFLKVVVSEPADAGVFLSTYGFCSNAFEQLTEIEKRRIRVGQESELVSLCRTYTKARAGIWIPPADLADVLYSHTAEAG